MGGYVGSRAVNLSTTSADVSGNATIGGNLTVSGTTVTIDSANAQTVDLGDNDKIRMGDGDDLQIYHDGSHSYIDEQGTGSLQIRATNLNIKSASNETYIACVADGSVEINHDNSKKFETTATGADITGTLKVAGSSVVTASTDADDLVIEKTGDTGLSILSTTTGRIYFGDAANDDAGSIRYVHSDNSMRFETDDAERMRLDGSGNLLVGTTTTDGGYDESDGGGSTVFMGASIGGAASGTAFVSRRAAPLQLNRQANDGDIAVFRKNGSTVGTIGTYVGDLTIGDADVGIRFDTGTGLVPWNVSTNAATNGAIDIGASGARFKDLYLSAGAYASFIAGTSDTNTSINFPGSDVTTFNNGGSERMRIDSSGNLLVGKTSANGTLAGAELRSDGYGVFTRSGGSPIQVRRLSSEGDLVVFLKDTTAVGSIGIESSGFVVDGEGSHAGLKMFAGSFGPRQNGSDIDATIDLGWSGGRFKNLYLSGGAYLGGTATANKLDSYESGTWSPVPKTVTTTIQHTVSRARYIRVGDLVTVSATLRIDENPSSGALVVTGLPFAASTNVENHGSLMFNNANFGKTYSTMCSYIYPPNAKIEFYGTVSGGGWEALNATVVGTNDTIQFTLAYMLG